MLLIPFLFLFFPVFAQPVYFLVYHLTSHFLLYLQNYKEFEAEILDLQIEKYGLSFDIKKCTTSGWALGGENMIGSLAPDCSRLQFSPNIQSGKYNKMDPLLIGTAVFKVSYTNFIALVPSQHKHLSGGNERNKVGVWDYKTQGETKISASILADVQKYTQNALSLLDNSLNIHHFGMWKVDWLSWRSWFYSGTKFAPRSWIFLKNFEVKLAAGAALQNLGLKLI